MKANNLLGNVSDSFPFFFASSSSWSLYSHRSERRRNLLKFNEESANASPTVNKAKKKLLNSSVSVPHGRKLDFARKQIESVVGGERRRSFVLVLVVVVVSQSSSRVEWLAWKRVIGWNDYNAVFLPFSTFPCPDGGWVVVDGKYSSSLMFKLLARHSPGTLRCLGWRMVLIFAWPVSHSFSSSSPVNRFLSIPDLCAISCGLAPLNTIIHQIPSPGDLFGAGGGGGREGELTVLINFWGFNFRDLSTSSSSSSILVGLITIF